MVRRWILLVLCFGLGTAVACSESGDDDDDDDTYDDDSWNDDDDSGDDDAATDGLFAGFRASPYGVIPFPEPDYWSYVGQEMAGKFAGAAPAGLWIVGEAGEDGECLLNFPSPGGAFSKVVFHNTDDNAGALDWFDTNGLSVWLQVEPGDADVSTLIELVLDRYGDHASVIGVGVDVEWFRWLANTDGKAVSDEEAQAWSEKARSYDSQYTVFLKHWLTGKMPPSYREGLVFVDDSQDFDSLSSLVAEFADWGDWFAPSPVMFQFGYEADRAWWSDLTDPPDEIGHAILNAVANTRGLFWVDFTIEEVFPPAKRW